MAVFIIFEAVISPNFFPKPEELEELDQKRRFLLAAILQTFRNYAFFEACINFPLLILDL